MDEKARLMLQDPPSLADGMDRETEKVNLNFVASHLRCFALCSTPL